MIKLTDEQQAILSTTGNIRINAVAGSGKTTTLVAYAKSRHPSMRILYLAFNKSVKDEAIRKFAEAGVNNVTVETAHSLAFRGVVRRYGFEIGFHSPLMIAQFLFPDQHLIPDHFVTATHVQHFASLFCNSTAQKVSEIDYRKYIKDPAELKRIDHHYDLLELHTRQYLAAMHKRQIVCSHDFYLKLFQLDNPQLSFDTILFDEAQDASPVMVAIVKAQNHAVRVVVGDSHQQIYRWRHAVNSMELFDYPQYTLTQSFRFPQLIADLAIETVRTKRHFMPMPQIVLRGTEPTAEVPIKTRAVIGRTNISLLAEAISLVKSKGENYKIWFEGHINSYLFGDEEGSLSDVLNLFNGKKEFIRNEMVKRCVDLEELKEYSKRTGETQLTRSIDLVNKHGKALPSLIALLRKRHVEPEMRHTADCCFSTVHRCKGLEYDEVFLCGDFTHEKMIHVFKEDPDRTPEELAEEVNLLYVAITRAKQRLHLPKECVPESFKQPMRHSIKLIRDSDSMEKLDAAASRKEWFWRSAGERSAQPKRERKTREPKGSEPREKPGSAGTFWSKSDEEFLKSEFKKGTPPRMIADTLGRTRGAITSRLKLLHLIEE